MTDTGATVRSTDGRSLAYTDLGDPDGQPLFYFHGLPGSRLNFVGPIGEQVLTGAGVRLISIDRPGFGASDFQPRRRIQDWPSDVVTVAHELGIERFGVLGYSSGGPYVLACARAMPDRLTFAGIVSGVGPIETPHFRRGMGKTDALMTRLALLAPPLARLAIRQAIRMAQRSPEKFSRQFDKELSEPDIKIHADPEYRDLVRTLFHDSTRLGPAGVVHDFKMHATPWGFALKEVDFPVQLWHGDADAIVPPHHSDYVAGRLANGKLTVLPGVGHLHTASGWHEFFTAAAG